MFGKRTTCGSGGSNQDSKPKHDGIDGLKSSQMRPRTALGLSHNRLIVGLCSKPTIMLR